MSEPLRVETWHGKRIDDMGPAALRRALRESMRAHFDDVRALRQRYEGRGHARIDELPTGYVFDHAHGVAHFRPRVPNGWIVFFAVGTFGWLAVVAFLAGVI